MSGLQLGWIDFSKEQRNKVLNVINLLSEPGAVDELGVGIIRDAFSNAFFPGTSTIQTRAKYFVLVPYILSELERTSGINPEKIMKILHEQELDLIEVLLESGEKGVIGETAGRKLKRKPSDIYWNGLRTYDIFSGGNMSIHEYVRVSCKVKNNKQALKSQGSISSNVEANDGDDTDAIVGEIAGALIRKPEVNTDWRDNLTIKLTMNEAEFLSNQIKNSCKGTMMEHVLTTINTDFLSCENFDELESLVATFPNSIRDDYKMAKEFADFIYGAHIRYNVILSQGENDKINEIWDSWHSEIQNNSMLDLHKILFNRFNISNGKLIKFLIDCKDAMVRNDIEQLDDKIITRERLLKGDKRSKLFNATEFEYREWVGINKLQYRLRNAQNIIKDIFEGLGEINA